MKRLNNVLTHLFQVCGVIFLGLVFTVSTALAETITKSFEIGTSTSGSSNFRTFTLPCRTRMVASVTYSRAGAAGESNDVPIFIEVREPATTAEGEGAVLAVKEGLKAARTPKIANLTGVTSSRSGCSIPWRVRQARRQRSRASRCQRYDSRKLQHAYDWSQCCWWPIRPATGSIDNKKRR
jgi:hypothetical protein